jgi:hypothetical protein
MTELSINIRNVCTTLRFLGDELDGLQLLQNEPQHITASQLVEQVRGEIPVIEAPVAMTYGEVYSAIAPEFAVLGHSFVINFGDFKIVTPLYGEEKSNKIGEITARLGGLGDFNSQMSQLNAPLIFTSSFVLGSTQDDLPIEFQTDAYQVVPFILPLPAKGDMPQENYKFYLVK